MIFLTIRSFIKLLLIVVCLHSISIVVLAHPTYVPNTPEVCKTMLPHHKREPQVSDSPFKVVVYGEKVQPGNSVFISLVSEEEEPDFLDFPEAYRRMLRDHHHKKKKGFKGFYIQGRESREDRPIGRFKPKEDHSVKVHDCDQGTDNAAFHGVKGHKTNVTIEWIAPDNFQGKVIFTTTFVKKYHKFWTHVNSSPVSVRLSRRL